MINAENIKYTHDDNLTDCDFSLQVNDREIVGLIGYGSSAKSTAIDIIAGFLSPKHGSIIINGKDVTKLDPADRGLFVVFNDYNLFEHLTIFQNIAIASSGASTLGKSEIEEINFIMGKMGLKGFNKRYPSQVSKIQKICTIFSRALISKKKILLIDCLFSNLDSYIRIEMLDLLLSLQKEYGLTILFSTNDFFDCMRICNRTAFMDHGRIIYYDKTKNLLDKPIDVPKVNQYLQNIFYIQQNK